MILAELADAAAVEPAIHSRNASVISISENRVERGIPYASRGPDLNDLGGHPETLKTPRLRNRNQSID